jgi:aerobic-type carbon monoxide dehydrogenase small subunit (CoxS/CutS family)
VTKLHIETTVNGEAAEFLCDPPESLLAALRDRLGLTGTKEGCATGDCGACSVLLDGRLVASCLHLAAEGRAVGHDDEVSPSDALHPATEAEHAPQAASARWSSSLPRRCSKESRPVGAPGQVLARRQLPPHRL